MSRVLNQRQVTQYIHSSEAVVRTPRLRQYQLSAVNEGGGGGDQCRQQLAMVALD